MQRIAILRTVFGVLCGLIVTSCELFVSEEPNQEAVARVGRIYLYAVDLPDFSYLSNEQAIKDAREAYVSEWAVKQLMFQNALNNLPEDVQWDLDRLVEAYKTDLYTKSYFDLISFSPSDTIVAAGELDSLYRREEASMRLDQDIVKLRYLVLGSQYSKPDEVMNRFKRFNDQDQHFIDSLYTHNYLRELQLNDSTWFNSASIAKQIAPITYRNSEEFLKPYQFFDIRDSTGFYFGQVLDTRKKGDIAPYAFALAELRQIVQNRKRFERLERQKQEMISEAIRKKTYETYE